MRISPGRGAAQARSIRTRSGRARARCAVPSTFRVPRAFTEVISSARLASNEKTDAACRTASHLQRTLDRGGVGRITDGGLDPVDTKRLEARRGSSPQISPRLGFGARHPPAPRSSVKPTYPVPPVTRTEQPLCTSRPNHRSTPPPAPPTAPRAVVATECPIPGIFACSSQPAPVPKPTMDTALSASHACLCAVAWRSGDDPGRRRLGEGAAEAITHLVTPNSATTPLGWRSRARPTGQIPRQNRGSFSQHCYVRGW